MAEIKTFADLLKATGATPFAPLPRGRRDGLAKLDGQTFVVLSVVGDDKARIATMTTPDPQEVKIGKKWVEVLGKTAGADGFKPVAVKCVKQGKAYVLTAPDA